MLGHIIYNYQHLDDCKIQQELSKKLYTQVFGGVHLVHAYNGNVSFGYTRYLEDKLITIKNRGHYQGAVDLINVGMKYFDESKDLPVKYVLVTAADTWLLNTRFLQSIIQEMEEKGQVLATSSWGSAQAPEKPAGFATDFFIIDLEWNRSAHLWPLNYAAFKKKFEDFFYLQFSQPIVEAAVQYKYQKYFADTYVDNDVWKNKSRFLRRIVEREPVHIKGSRKNEWPRIGLYTAPDPTAKQKVLKKLALKLGPEADRLVRAKDTTYYNRVPDNIAHS